MSRIQIPLQLSSDDMHYEEELVQYLRHLKHDYDYTVNIEPMPTPRARATARKMYVGGSEKMVATVYNPTEYTKYKKQIIAIVKKEAKIPRGNYNKIFATFYIPYSKSTPKKNLIEGAPHLKKGDWDNFAKGLCDALQGDRNEGIEGVLIDDGTIHMGSVRKVYTTNPTGFIRFNLI